MSSYASISSDKLSRLIGTGNAPTLIDVRIDEDFAADPRLIPGATRRSHPEVQDWASAVDRPIRRGGLPKRPEAERGDRRLAAPQPASRPKSSKAGTLAGGRLNCRPSRPARYRHGTGAVARSGSRDHGPKIDRIACPWLIRRFIDPSAVFLFVAAAEVQAVSERFNATPFDVENVFWSHRGELCTFDVMVEEFGLATPPLQRLATMVRAADTGRLDLSPEAPGLLAASLGLSRMYDDDLEQLSAGMLLYDAFFRWCRDATKETHNWPTNKAKP